MTALESIQAPVADELARYRGQFADVLRSDNPLLQTALDHVARRAGKLARPTLVFLCARLFGSVTQAVTDVAVALELLHTASLIHDDVVDESDRRRGQKSLNAEMSNQVAVLVGDYVLGLALSRAARTGDIRVVESVARLGRTLADGELEQLRNVGADTLSDVDYYKVVSKKTASLFATAARLGVLVGGGSKADAERMEQFGKLVGMCFQLRDDLFDYEESPDTGKPAGNDMREGKLTLPVIYAVNRTGDEAMLRKALAVRAGEAGEDDIRELVAFARGQGGVDYANWSMREFRVMADGLVNDSRDPAVAKSLREYAAFVSERVS